MSRVLLVSLTLALALLPLVARRGEAQQREQTEEISVAEAIKRLKSQNRDEVRTAIQLLAVSSAPQAVQPIVEFLRSGPPDAMTNDAIVALGGTASPAAVETLIDYMRHRRTDVRVRAIEALANIRDGRVAAAIEQGLRDSESRVRSAAALALGRIGARSTVDTLFRALERNIPEAATAIGQLGEGPAAEKLCTYLRRRPLRELLPGLREFLKRRDLAEGPKLQIVNSLVDVSGIEVKRFLMEIEEGIPSPPRSALRRAIDEGIRRIPGVVDLGPAGGGPVPAANPAGPPSAAPAPTPTKAVPAPPPAPAKAAPVPGKRAPR